MRPPLSVQRALVLLIGAVAVAAVSVVCSIIAVAHMNSATRRLRDLGFTAGDVRELRESVGGSLTSIVVLSALVTVLVAIGAMVVRRPSSRARLVVSFAAGIGLFLTFVTLSASPEEFTSSDGPPAVRAVYENLLPSWYVYVTSFFVAAEAIVLIATVVLMYRSDAGEYYRAGKIGGEDSLGEILLRRRREADESAS